MTFAKRYRIRQYLLSAIWLKPLIGLTLGILFARLTYWLDTAFGWRLLNFSAAGARDIVGTMCGAMLTFIVFLFSTQIIVAQIASQQLTPRLIATVVAKGPVKNAAALFLFNFIYCTAVMARIDDRTPELQVFLVIVQSIGCIAMFLHVVDYTAKAISPGKLLAGIGELGNGIINDVYPLIFAGEDGKNVGSEPAPQGSEEIQIVVHKSSASVLLAVDYNELLRVANDEDCMITVIPQVGDFVPKEDALFHVVRNANPVDEHKLRKLVAFGNERTMDQDPAFAMRIIVDVACKALSAAINDPTTAVVAIDPLHRLLRRLGGRRLDTGKIYNDAGRLCVVYRTPNWEDYVALASTEIRLFGARSIQVCHRLKVMYLDLIKLLPPQRAAALQSELNLLHRSIEREFIEPEDRYRAMTGDNKGMGNGNLSAPHPHHFDP